MQTQGFPAAAPFLPLQPPGFSCSPPCTPEASAPDAQLSPHLRPPLPACCRGQVFQEPPLFHRLGCEQFGTSDSLCPLPRFPAGGFCPLVIPAPSHLGQHLPKAGGKLPWSPPALEVHSVLPWIQVSPGKPQNLPLSPLHAPSPCSLSSAGPRPSASPGDHARFLLCPPHLGGHHQSCLCESREVREILGEHPESVALRSIPGKTLAGPANTSSDQVDWLCPAKEPFPTWSHFPVSDDRENVFSGFLPNRETESFWQDRPGSDGPWGHLPAVVAQCGPWAWVSTHP